MTEKPSPVGQSDDESGGVARLEVLDPTSRRKSCGTGANRSRRCATRTENADPNATSGLRSCRRRSERGEVFPVAILFVGVLLTILIGVHVVLFSMAETAAQAAADRGVTSAQAAPLGPSSCGTLTEPYSGQMVTPVDERECQGVVAAWRAMTVSGSMVRQTQPPTVTIDQGAGIVSVISYGAVVSPIFGSIEVAGSACGPLDLVPGDVPTRADASEC